MAVVLLDAAVSVADGIRGSLAKPAEEDLTFHFVRTISGCSEHTPKHSIKVFTAMAQHLKRVAQADLTEAPMTSKIEGNLQ